MNAYYIKEENYEWKETKAQSLSSAKRAAERDRLFRGTDIAVGQMFGGEVHAIAIKRHPDALNMQAKGVWEEVSY